MIELCELIGQDGAIIALDQEKAYDRIRHDYLWKVMEKMGIPNAYMSTIRNLYANAKTKVILNGIISDEFPIIRGVHQGDPLSCLLFNITIEPLSIALRENPSLNGLTIETPSLTQRVIVSLF